VGTRPALAAQHLTLICNIFIFGQTKYTVDVVDLVAQDETLEHQALDTRPDISDLCQDSWMSRRNAPWHTVRPQHCRSHKWIEWLHWLGFG
jgi:hypothetical protein